MEKIAPLNPGIKHLKSIYNCDGAVEGRTLFLLDGAARLGYMQIIETAYLHRGSLKIHESLCCKRTFVDFHPRCTGAGEISGLA